MLWMLPLLAWLAALVVTTFLFRTRRLRTPWHLDLAALGLLALGVLGFFWRVIAGKNWMPADGGDLVSFLFPTYRFAASTLARGEWPLWNPYAYAGAPHVGDIQAGFLYPPNLLLFLTNPRFPYSALQALSMAHLWFAGAGMYLLLGRGFGLRRIAAVAGAVAFMFSDALLTHFGNLNFNAVMSWLPWIFWAWLGVLAPERIAQEDKPGHEVAPKRSPRNRLEFPPRYLVLTGILLALSISAGHIQGTLFTILALTFYTAGWLFLRRDEAGARLRTVAVALGLAGAVLLGSLLAAPVLLPALQLAGATARVDWNYTAAAGYSLSPAQLIGWLIPGFFGRGPQFHWGAWPRVEVGYLGILPLLLASVAIPLRHRSEGRALWSWFTVVSASFIFSLGIYAIPHGWLTLLPGFAQLRAPARFVLLTDFGLAALAAFGLDALLRSLTRANHNTLVRLSRGLAWAVGAVFLVVLPLAYLALLLVQDRDPSIVTRVSISLIAVVDFAVLLGASALWLSARRRELGKPVTLGWLAVALIFVDVASLGAYQDLGERDPSQTYQHDQIAAFLANQESPFRIDSRTQIESLWQPDTALVYGLEDVNGVANPLVLADFERYWQALGSRSTPMYDLLNIRYVLGKKDVVLDWDKFALAFDGDPQVNVYENRHALPRAFIVPAVQFQPTQDLVLQAVRAPGFDPLHFAVILGPSDQSLPVGGLGTVTGIETSQNLLSFRTNTDAAALVFLSQVWYPGWQVFVDGRNIGQPYRTNYLFQAVSVPSGEHSVELRFAPPMWGVGWWLTGITSVLLLIGIVLTAASRKRDRRNNGD